MRDTVSGATVRTYLADLADLDQVHDMAARIRAAEPRLDALVNNAVAGGGAEPRPQSAGVGTAQASAIARVSQ